MDKIKKEFKENPVFAVGVIVVSTWGATVVLRSLAKTIEASAIAFHAVRAL